MPPLVWDKVGDRTYHTGLDRGVLYLPNGEAVVWNGLTNVKEDGTIETESVYFDGMQISDLQKIGSFRGTLNALTYPDEFAELEGNVYIQPGVLATGQMARRFGLSYRTIVGNDTSEPDYRIHLLYNVLAIPSEKTSGTISADPEPEEFEWNLTAIPSEVPGMRPTSHFIIETRGIDPWLLEDLEEALYGNSSASATLMPLDEMIEFLNTWYRVKVIDHGDGTWTAEEARPGFITLRTGSEAGYFDMVNVNAVYTDSDQYILSDTEHDLSNPTVEVENHGNGTWTATTDVDGIITVDSEGYFTISDIEVVFQGPLFYRLNEYER